MIKSATVLIAVVLAACGTNGPAGRAAVQQPAPSASSSATPAPTLRPAGPHPSVVAAARAEVAGTHRLSGVVFTTVAGQRQPLAGAAVNIWAQKPGAGISLWFALGHGIWTDANGQFSVADLGDMLYLIEVPLNGYVQPIVQALELRSDAMLDIELVPEAVAAAGGLPPLPTRGATISGLVVETVGGVRRPVPAARVTLWWNFDETALATTLTDPNGRFLFAGVPAGTLPISARRVATDSPGAMVMVSSGNVSVELEIKHGP